MHRPQLRGYGILFPPSACLNSRNLPSMSGSQSSRIAGATKVVTQLGAVPLPPGTSAFLC